MDTRVPKNIISGFEEDFKEIVGDFQNVSPNLDLKEFFAYWTNKSFDYIFANRFDPRELLESISEINRFLVKVIAETSDQEDGRRLIALYFMLCLCLKQPVRLRRRIRFDCVDIIQVERLCSDSEGAKFAWNKLKSIQAVDVVEERTIYGPSMLNNRGSKKGPETETSSETMNANDDLIFIENKIEPTIQDLDGICEPYEQIKASLKLDEYADSTVELVSEGPIREIIDETKHILLNYKALGR